MDNDIVNIPMKVLVGRVMSDSYFLVNTLVISMYGWNRNILEKKYLALAKSSVLKSKQSEYKWKWSGSDLK